MTQDRYIDTRKSYFLAFLTMGPVKTCVAWAPYIISGWFSQIFLKTRDPKATWVFMLYATGVALGAACLYLNKPVVGATLGVSVGITISLLLGATLCSVLWKDNAREY